MSSSTIKTVSTSNTIPKEINTISDSITSIIELDTKLISIRDEIKGQKWDSLSDSRMIFFRYINELNLNTILQLAFLCESSHRSKDKEWLQARFPHLKKQINDISDINAYSSNRLNHISSHILDTFILGYFNEFETRLRNITRELKTIKNPDKKNDFLNGNESFHLIYRGLFESYLSLKQSDYEVLKIFAAIRNTIHNSGFYFPLSPKSPTFKYRDATYQFNYGKPINFITKEFRQNILLDMLELWRKILINYKIKNIELINDPLSDIEFK